MAEGGAGRPLRRLAGAWSRRGWEGVGFWAIRPPKSGAHPQAQQPPSGVRPGHAFHPDPPPASCAAHPSPGPAAGARTSPHSPHSRGLGGRSCDLFTHEPQAAWLPLINELKSHSFLLPALLRVPEPVTWERGDVLMTLAKKRRVAVSSHGSQEHPVVRTSQKLQLHSRSPFSRQGTTEQREGRLCRRPCWAGTELGSSKAGPTSQPPPPQALRSRLWETTPAQTLRPAA